MERFYPFEHKKEQEEKQETVREEQASGEQGKGRRDGNSRSSLVIHSGKVTERARQIKERKERENNPGTYRPYRRDDRKDRFAEHRGNGFEKKRFDSEKDLRGKHLELVVKENSEYGSFLETEDGKRILLPFAEQTVRPQPGDKVKVSIYEDKGGRLTATMREPLVKVGETGILTVAAVTKIGIFADNGMPKQVLIPFREMLHTPEPGDQILVYLYLDKSGREAGTMRVYRHLQKESGYKENEHVEGFVYEVNPDLGVFVAVDDRYYGMIPISEVFSTLKYGDRIEARVSKVREDGKLDLLLREKLYQSADRDAEVILETLKANGGSLPYADRADSDFIRENFSMSKNQFKRALGGLYRKRLIDIDRENDSVTLLAQLKKKKEK